MKISAFMTSFENLRIENVGFRRLSVLLAISNLVLIGRIINDDPVTVLVPPDLDKAVEITRNRASAGLKESWALYLADLMGNVTPSNAQFVMERIAPLLDAALYHAVMNNLSEQITALKADQVSLSYRPHQVIYEESSDKVFVTGDQVIHGHDGRPEQRHRTFEFRFRIKDYRPLLEAIDVYPDEPKTLEALSHSHPVSTASNP